MVHFQIGPKPKSRPQTFPFDMYDISTCNLIKVICKKLVVVVFLILKWDEEIEIQTLGLGNMLTFVNFFM